MSLDALVVGTSLPDYLVSARATDDPGENKIHEDAMAREFGFRGGLVPGVTVYAWMTHPVVKTLGPAWLDHGTFSVRLAKPVYFGQPVTVQASVAAHSKQEVSIQARVVNDEGDLCATATMGLPLGPLLPLPDLAAYPAAPLPQERPPVSRGYLASHGVLGTPELEITRSVARSFLERVSESLPLYLDREAPVHPALYLDQANRALDRNVRVSPWIHVESQGQHLEIVRVGERLETRVRVKSLFEGKGHEFVELDLLLLAERTRPVATVRHVAIYRLRRGPEPGPPP
ncbi:MAG TPA: MaoC family dehydratase [Methylomirabilota bacterium]|nr:MaoC family dehydratase [Methylomirabilota bacterium]